MPYLDQLDGREMKFLGNWQDMPYLTGMRSELNEEKCGILIHTLLHQSQFSEWNIARSYLSIAEAGSIERPSS
jgi:hypothetical protein